MASVARRRVGRPQTGIESHQLRLPRAVLPCSGTTTFRLEGNLDLDLGVTVGRRGTNGGANAMACCRSSDHLVRRSDCVVRRGEMPEASVLTVFLLSCGLIAPCAMPAQDGGGSVDRLLQELVALERSALDRWIKLDPQGYLDLQAPDVTYFDPFTERRVDGLDAMQVRLAPMKKVATGRVRAVRAPTLRTLVDRAP